MRLDRPLAISTLITPFAFAFKLEFFLEPNCAGEFLGSWVGGEAQGCHQNFVGEAEGVVVQSTGKVDDNTVVAFYSSNDCNPSKAISEANAGCIAIDSFAAEYKSFNVIGSSDSTGAKVRRSPRSMTKLARDDTANSTTGDDQDNITTQHSTESLLDSRVREHGEISDYQGKTYKWQQVAQGSWRGINPEDWDDTIHVLGERNINAAPLPTTDIAIRDLIEFDKRNFLYATCGLVKNCVLAAAQSTGYTVSAVGSAFIAKALAVSHTANVWEFLNQPLIVALTIDQAGAVLSGVVSAVTAAKLPASKCSSSGTDADALQSIINGIAALNPSRAIQATVSVGSATGTFSMEAVVTGQRGDGNTCGAPATDPTNG